MTISMRSVSMLVAVALVVAQAQAADLAKGLTEKGPADLKSAGPLAFGPEGILFVGDPLGGAVLALDTAERPVESARGPLEVQQLGDKVAALLGTTSDQIQVNDLAVNPESAMVYLSVARDPGPKASPVIVRIDHTGKLSELPLDDIKHARAELPNLPGPEERDRRGQSQRMESITDLAFVDGRVFVAGLSNEEFASKLRSIPFPFAKADSGTSVEIYHGAHGQFETRSPVRTFVPYAIAGEPYLLAAYTCTPLVKFPVAELSPGSKLRGTTVAELGNRNRPLDMIVYEKDGKNYLLLANSSRGVMKIDTDDVETDEGIEQKIEETAGLKYETIEGLKNVHQLDRLDAENALVLVQTEGGSLSLQTVPLP
ncbi:MAG: hypothetical protein WD847_13970 [Pirellulales bacterium]